MSEPAFYAQKEKKLLALASSHFGPGLSAAETKVLRDSVRPGVPEVPKGADGRELPPTGRVVRPELLRWLAMDAEPAALIDVNGIWVMHATLQGDIDLADCRVPFSFAFETCVLVGVLALTDAILQSVDIRKSRILQGMNARGIDCRGDFVLAECECKGEISFENAHIGGDLVLS